MDSAMDLSLRNSTDSSPASLQGISSAIMTPSSLKLPVPTSSPGVKIVRPIPRPPWSIVWYQNLWTISSSSSLNQNESKSESGCDGNNESEEGSKTTVVFRTNERSSFSVLNNLSTNAVNNCVNHNYNCNFPYGSSAEEQQIMQQQHRISQFPTEKYNVLVNDTTPSASCSSVFKAKHTDHPGDQHNFTISQKPMLRKEYSSDEDDIDSDNSENIVVTTSSSFSTGLERDSMIKSSTCSLDKSELAEVLAGNHYQNEDNRSHQATAILDVACCDGPVQFKRISNPNFALTVEHNELCPPVFPVDGNKTVTVPKGITRPHKHEVKRLHEMYDEEQADRSRCFSSNSAVPEGGKPPRQFPHQFHHPVEDGEFDNLTANAGASSAVTTHKSYLCIYCNQSFKSLFCYQKHKKRHLNPVSVDITTTTAANSTSYRSGGGVGTTNKKGGGGVSTGCGDGGGGSGGGGGGTVGIVPENAKAKTKDLNVQFFPCKKCGCKFPSYYFVHKHRKICH